MLTRRRLLRTVAAAVSFIATAAEAADASMLSVDDPAAKAVKYVEDATKAKRAAAVPTP